MSYTVTLTDQQFSDMMRALAVAEDTARRIGQDDTADRYDVLWRSLASGHALR